MHIDYHTRTAASSIGFRHSAPGCRSSHSKPILFRCKPKPRREIQAAGRQDYIVKYAVESSCAINVINADVTARTGLQFSQQFVSLPPLQ